MKRANWPRETRNKGSTVVNGAGVGLAGNGAFHEANG